MKAFSASVGITARSIVVRVLLSWCLAIAAFACGGADRVTPTDLLLGLTSHVSPEEAQRMLNVRQDNWRVIEDTKSSANDKRPPYHLLVVAVSNASSYGQRGEARLSFFNDRLMQIAFYPDDVSRFLRKLKEETGVDLEKSGVHKMASGAEAVARKDLKNAYSVVVSNPDLRKEHESWIRRYSESPLGDPRARAS